MDVSDVATPDEVDDISADNAAAAPAYAAGAPAQESSESSEEEEDSDYEEDEDEKRERLRYESKVLGARFIKGKRIDKQGKQWVG